LGFQTAFVSIRKEQISHNMKVQDDNSVRKMEGIFKAFQTDNKPICRDFSCARLLASFVREDLWVNGTIAMFWRYDGCVYFYTICLK